MVTVEHATADDRAAWQRLYTGYTDYYRVDADARLYDTVWGWVRDDANPFFCLLARDGDGDVAGLMHFRAVCSPLDGAVTGFLDDLYVVPERRGRGIADALFVRLRSEGERRGWPSISWLTADDNYRARSLYDRLATRTTWLTYQLDL